ncbi:MAG: hypothetical protein J1F40_07875 [Prevotellaceae bacterium]|nr:hypothetical protein [Prevotellaceae bacterium]
MLRTWRACNWGGSMGNEGKSHGGEIVSNFADENAFESRMLLNEKN